MNRKTTLLSLKCLLILAFAQVAQAQIYSNGPLSTGATALGGGAAPAGYTWSELQHNTGNTAQTSASVGTSGWYTANGVTSFSLADDFVVPSGFVWDLTSLEFFIYQTNSTALPVDELRIQIFNGVPGAAGTTLVAGSATTNVLNVANSGEAMIYRITDSQVPTTVAAPLTNRRIWKIRGNLTASLQAGTYWVVYQFHPTNNATNTLSPHVTLPGTRAVPGANAKSKASPTAAWVDISDVGTPASAPGTGVPCALPFNLYGTSATASVANDACSGALIATTLPYTNVQTLANLSTNNSGFLSGCTTPMNDGLWYTFTGTGNAMTVAITGLDTSFDAQLDVYTGACGGFTGCVGSADDDIDGGDETVTFNSTLGVTYFVNVGNMNDTTDAPEGNFTMRISSSAMGNDDFAMENFRAYPNPVKDILNLSYDQEISNVEVYNVLGQKVLGQAINASQSQLNVSSLTAGTYLVKVVSGNQSKAIRIIKN